jgi:two-component system nitrogen regulation sensor histidine kinase GlnL
MEFKPETEQLTRVFENINTAILLFDSNLRLKCLNPAAEMLLSSSAHRLIGTMANELFLSEELISSLEQVVKTGHPVTERELGLRLVHDHNVTVDITITPMIDPRRERELLVEINQVDRMLRIAREEGLLAQTATSRALVRGLAHEIKNPLGGLRGAAQLLERELGDDELKEYTNIIISEADRLQVLMDRMLGPRALPQKVSLNIHEVLERVRQLVQAEIAPEIILRSDYDPSIPEIHADRDQLIQSFLNLLRNAVQAVGNSGEITIRSRTLRQYTIGQNRYKLVARIEIIDNGAGIDPDMKESIFLPMVTGRAEGTGLGLPMAQSLINLNGGLVECESRPGHTVFTVLLPINE